MSFDWLVRGILMSDSAANPNIYSTEVLSDSPLIYWRFNESSGNAQDSSGNGNIGTAVGVTYAQPGLLEQSADKSFKFSGTLDGSYVEITLPAPITGNFTLEALVKDASITANLEEGIIGLGASSFWLARLSIGLTVKRPTFGVMNTATGEAKAESLAPIYTDTVYHLFATFSAPTLKLLVNGQLKSTVTLSGTRVSHDNRVIVGHRYNGSSRVVPSDAFIDEIAVYNTALSEARGKAHYEQAIGFNVYAGAGHRYWRVNCSANNGDGFTSMSQVEFRGSAGGLDLTGTRTVLGNFSSNANGFDNDNSTFFSTSTTNLPRWIGYDFGEALDINEVALTCQEGGGVAGARAFKDFTIEWSDDGVVWNVSNTITNETGWVSASSSAEQRLFPVYP